VANRSFARPRADVRFWPGDARELRDMEVVLVTSDRDPARAAERVRLGAAGVEATD